MLKTWNGRSIFPVSWLGREGDLERPDLQALAAVVRVVGREAAVVGARQALAGLVPPRRRLPHAGSRARPVGAVEEPDEAQGLVDQRRRRPPGPVQVRGRGDADRRPLLHRRLDVVVVAGERHGHVVVVLRRRRRGRRRGWRGGGGSAATAPGGGAHCGAGLHASARQTSARIVSGRTAELGISSLNFRTEREEPPRERTSPPGRSDGYLKVTSTRRAPQPRRSARLVIT